MWSLDHPWWEYIVRSLVVYFVVFILLRLFGKKQLGEMGPFDLVLLLIISESISSGITGGDNSLGAAIIAVTTFVLLNRLMDILAFKFETIEKILDGDARVIIEKGVVNKKLCAEEYISHQELASSIRENQYSDIKDVPRAVLETNGKISVLEK